ncbi:hypothetical protein QR680_012623 [Steinernema hermaphroditum]|uniref:EB domain-containing protein n=1 Tax=Steinernema hermaphroditum TaxID=289476 RepID=A0AA39M0U2_9BILA|nr:hypothetical protein QR680_012623 [Steinernema hermaphroditum]
MHPCGQKALAECPLNKVPLHGRCVPKRSVGDGCREQAECPEGALCEADKCLCPRGYTWIAGGCEESPLCAGLETLRVAENGTAQCLTLAAWNQSCGEAVECVGLLRCSAEGRCECLGRLEEGLCLEAEDSCGDQNKILHRGLCLSPTERSCLSDVDCPEGSCGANLRCSSEEIVCRPDEVAVDRLCFPQVRLDEACRRNEQCVGASCIEGRCGCVADEVEVDGICAKNNGFCRQTNSVFWKGECLPRVTLGASCHTSSQCPRRSVCFNATCQCPSGTTHDGDGCREYTESPRLLEEGLLMGQKCLRTEDCVAPLACLQRMCQCPLGGVFDGLQCLPTPQSPIPLNPKPLDCPRGTTRVGERCSPLMPPGNECQASAQCLDGAICVGGVCRCEATIAFGGYCMLKGGAEGCQINQVASKDRCLESVVPNGHGCTEDLQCLGGSLCDATGICLCPGGEGAWMGYCLEGKSLEKRGNDRCKQGEGICFAPQVVGGACVVSAQCPQSTLCSRRHLCECELGDVFPDGSCPSRGTPCNAYQVHVDDVCWDTVVVGGRCEKKEQCITKDSTCSASSKRCECTEDTEFDGDQCVALAGVRCPPRSVIANGMCFGTVAPGQFCQFDAQCAPHLGVCRQYACQCPEGHLEVDGEHALRDHRKFEMVDFWWHSYGS